MLMNKKQLKQSNVQQIPLSKQGQSLEKPQKFEKYTFKDEESQKGGLQQGEQCKEQNSNQQGQLQFEQEKSSKLFRKSSKLLQYAQFLKKGTKNATDTQKSAYNSIQYSIKLRIKLQQNEIILQETRISGSRHQNSKNQDYSFEIIQIQNDNSSQVFQIKVRLGNLYLKILVLEQVDELESKQGQTENQSNLIAVGAFGRVYLYQSFFSQNQNHTKYIVKSLAIKDKKYFIEIFLSSLKEYSLSLIMSALGIGPKIKRNFGFDMVLRQNKIEFAMELCIPYKTGRYPLDQMSTQLRENMLAMHHFHIIHHDIKPENIAFSPFFNKWVFIDFGLSTIICEQVGEKSSVKFLGTYQYTTQQMRQTFFKKGWVDLYYNDVFGLNVTLKHFQTIQDQSHNLQEWNIPGQFNSLNSLRCDQPMEWSLNNYHHQGGFSLEQNSQSKGNTKQSNKEIYQLLYMFKYNVLKMNICQVREIWRLLEVNFQTNIQRQRQRFKAFLCNSVRFLEKYPLNGFIRDVYRDIVAKSMQTLGLKEIISNKLLTNTASFSIQNSYSESGATFKGRMFLLAQNYGSDVADLIKMSQFFYSKNENEIKNILLYKTNLLTTEEYFELFFNYITFRQRIFNCSLEEKVQVAKIFLQFSEKQGLISRKVQDFHEPVGKVSLGRSLIITCLDSLIEYCSLAPTSIFKAKYFTQIVNEYIFINPLILRQGNLSRNYQMQFVLIAVRLAHDLSGFIVSCWKIMQAFKFLHFKNQHTYFSLYEGDNYFWNFIFIYLKQKEVLIDDQFIQLRRSMYGDRLQLQVTNLVRVQHRADVGDGIRLFQLLQQLAHQIWVEENHFHHRYYRYLKSKYLQFKQSSQTIRSLSHRDRVYLQETLKNKYIQLLMISQTLPPQETEQLLVSYMKYVNEKKINIKFFEMTEKFCQQKDLCSLVAITQKIDYLINCPQISNQYLANNRCYINSSNGKVQNAVKLIRTVIENLRVNAFGQNFLCSLITYFKPLNSWRFKLSDQQHKALRQEITCLQNDLLRKVVLNLKRYLEYIHHKGSSTGGLQFVQKINQQRCKKCFIRIYNNLNLNLRFQDKRQQQELYQIYQKYFAKFSYEILELKYEIFQKSQSITNFEGSPKSVKQSQLKQLQSRIAHYDYRIMLQTFKYDKFLQKFKYYKDIFKGEYSYQLQFLRNYLKVVRKKINVMYLIYRKHIKQDNQFLDYLQKIRTTVNRGNCDNQGMNQQQVLCNASFAISYLTECFKQQINFQSYAFHLQIFSYIVIHMWYHDRQVFFQHMIQKLSLWILTDQTVCFEQAYHQIVHLIGIILIITGPERKQFVKAVMKYARKYMSQKLSELNSRQENKSFYKVVHYQLSVILHFVDFLAVRQLYDNLQTIIKLFKVCTMSLQYQTFISRPFCKHFLYVIYFNLISQLPTVEMLQQIQPLLFQKKRIYLKSYRRYILKKLIKQNTQKKNFFAVDCPQIVANILLLKESEGDGFLDITKKNIINRKIKLILRNMI